MPQRILARLVEQLPSATQSTQAVTGVPGQVAADVASVKGVAALGNVVDNEHDDLGDGPHDVHGVVRVRRTGACRTDILIRDLRSLFRRLLSLARRSSLP